MMMMMSYEEIAMLQAEQWKTRMKREPSFTNILSKRTQTRINKIIPEKIHRGITSAIKHMVKVVCAGAEFTTPIPLQSGTLEERENKIRERIKFYRNTATVEGAITGAGGILLGLADFPMWLVIKIKMLYDIAALYGYNVGNYKERIFLLHIFELYFSSQQHRIKTIQIIEDWITYQKTLPIRQEDFDWRNFQQEYRDYIDIAKLLQLVPGIGAPVGAIVNHRLTEKLGLTAINAYRLRWNSAEKIAGFSNEFPATFH
jgi:hypothetical protein